MPIDSAGVLVAVRCDTATVCRGITATVCRGIYNFVLFTVVKVPPPTVTLPLFFLASMAAYHIDNER